MKKIILAVAVILFTAVFVYSQDSVKVMFDKLWVTKDKTERKILKEKIIEMSPDSEYGLLCRSMLKETDSTTKIDLCTQAIDLRNDFWEAYLQRGLVYGKSLRITQEHLRI